MNDTKLPTSAISDFEVESSFLLTTAKQQRKMPKEIPTTKKKTSTGLVTDFPFTIVIGDNPMILSTINLSTMNAMVFDSLIEGMVEEEELKL